MMLWCSQCDVVTINAPLHAGTQGLFNDEMLAKMKKGSYLVNTARGAIVDRDALVRAVESGHIAGKLSADSASPPACSLAVSGRGQSCAALSMRMAVSRPDAGSTAAASACRGFETSRACVR